MVEGSNVAKKCVHLIEERPLSIIRLLATYKDYNGQSAIQDATESIRAKSDQDLRLSEAKCVEFCTNVLDNGQPREVAIKFTSNTEHFRREVDLRDKL